MPDIPAVHCEARKVSYRQTKEGLVVAFVIHPNDMPDTLATAPLGQRYMLALAAIGDDEQPLATGKEVVPHSTGLIRSPGEAGDNVMPPSYEAGVRRPGVEPSSPTARARASDLGRERYQEAPPMAQALTRSAMLVKDERFQGWAATQVRPEVFGLEAYTEEGAADFIRESCCEGRSRSLIAEDPEAYRKFLALETMFKIAVGEISEPR